MQFLGVPNSAITAPFAFVYTLAIAFLMVSRLPVFSSKRHGKRVPAEMVLPIFVVIVLFFALLIAYPWEVLTIGTVIYLAALPIGWLAYRDAVRKDKANAAHEPAAQAGSAATQAVPSSPSPRTDHPADERPVRLN